MNTIPKNSLILALVAGSLAAGAVAQDARRPGKQHADVLAMQAGLPADAGGSQQKGDAPLGRRAGTRDLIPAYDDRPADVIAAQNSSDAQQRRRPKDAIAAYDDRPADVIAAQNSSDTQQRRRPKDAIAAHDDRPADVLAAQNSSDAQHRRGRDLPADALALQGDVPADVRFVQDATGRLIAAVPDTGGSCLEEMLIFHRRDHGIEMQVLVDEYPMLVVFGRGFAEAPIKLPGGDLLLVQPDAVLLFTRDNATLLIPAGFDDGLFVQPVKLSRDGLCAGDVTIL